MSIFNYEEKYLAHTDLIQYNRIDGVWNNVPLYSVRDSILNPIIGKYAEFLNKKKTSIEKLYVLRPTSNGSNTYNLAELEYSGSGGGVSSWNDLLDKPDTLLGFGITDGVSLNLFNNHINNQGDQKHLSSTQLNSVLQLLSFWSLDEDGNLFTNRNLYSTGEIAAYSLGISGGSSGVSSLFQLEDIEFSLPLEDDQVLKYNATLEKWINGTGGSGGTTVSWGLTSNNLSPLTVAGVSKTVALSGHTHIRSDISWGGTALQYINGLGNLVTFPSISSGTVTSVSAGNGMDFTTITTTGTITLGTPSGITLSSINSVNASTHTHAFVPGGTTSQYIRGDGSLANFPAVGGTGTVTSITAGNGMNFTNITTTGTITLGTPSSITLSTTNRSYTNSHTHAFNPGGTTAQYINGAGTLSNFPTIATPNNGTLSLTTEKGLTGSATFTANQAGNSTFTISPTYGITSNTFAQGNDSRIINGQAAYDWGNHASVGYVTSSSLNSYVAKTDSLYIGTTAVPLNRTSGTLDLNGIGVLSVKRVSTGSSVYFGNYGNFEGLVCDAEGAVIIGMNESNYATYLGYGNVGIGTQTPSASLHVIGNTLSTAYKLASGWSFESSGAELQIKYNGAVRNRILSDGSFVSVGEITAYGAASSGSGSTDFLSLSQGGDVLGKVGFTGTIYPQIRGNGTQLVLSHSDQVNTGTVYLVNNTLRRGASTTMTLGDASYLWANTYTDKITLGNGWTIEQTSSSLTIKRNGVVKSTINA